MNLLNKCTNKELELMKKVGVNLEDKDYSNDELKRFKRNITEYIMKIRR